MIRINLLPLREIEAQLGRRQELMIGGACLAATLLGLGALYLYQSRELSRLEGELARVQSEIAKLDAQVKEVSALEKTVKELREKHGIIRELEKSRTGPVKVMDGLAAAAPPRLWLTEFKEAGGTATLNGLALDNSSVADFLQALSRLPYFREVELLETIQVEQDGRPLQRFSIKSALAYHAGAPEPEGEAATKAKKP
jgi:type IV pilus assembly protein PilN